MTKRTLKDIKKDEAALESAFEDLDRDKDKLRNVELKTFDNFSSSLYAFRRLEYQLEGETAAQQWTDTISQFQRIENLLNEFFQEGYAHLKKKERGLEENKDQLVSEKHRAYQEEEDGH